MQPGTAKPSVFISYSRRDGDFAERLLQGLEATGHDAHLDRHDIAPGEDWRGRLGGLIESADTIVFVVSPDSVDSDICDWEVNRAERLGKRILPVVCRDPAADAVPDRLQRLNYIFMRNPAEEKEGLGKLVSAIAVDIGWVRAHTRYGERASDWERAGRASRLLLRGSDIDAAEAWRDGRPVSAPSPTELHLAFIAGSRKAAGRRLRGWIGGALAVAALTAGLAVVAILQRQAAEQSRAETQATLATADFRQGTQLLESTETSATGIAFLARAARAGDRRAMTRLWTLLQQRSFWIPAETGTTAAPVAPAPVPVAPEILTRFAKVEIDGQQIEPHFVAASADSSLVFTSAGGVVEGIDTRFRIWRRDGTPVTGWLVPAYDGDFYIQTMEGIFSADGRYLAVVANVHREPSYVVVYQLDGMQPVGNPVVSSGLSPHYQSAGFTDVRFVVRPARDGFDAATLLVTASWKGDAAAHEVVDGAVVEIARASHRTRVTQAVFDPERLWLVSASEDGVVQVSDLGSGPDEAPVGNPLLVEWRVAALSVASPAGLLIAPENGDVRRFDLSLPIRSPVQPAELPSGEPSHCADWTQPGEAAAGAAAPVLLSHPSGRRILRVGDRQAGVTASDPAAPVAMSPVYASDLVLVCLDRAGERITVTTSDFRTEVWSPGFTARLGQVLDERRHFSQGNTPETTQAVELSPDGRHALLRSFFWNPPNLGIRWISLWDVPSGLLLTDRTRFVDGWSPSPVVPDITESVLDKDGRHVLLTGEAEGGSRVIVRSVSIEPPEAIRPWLPDYVEALAGATLGPDGVPATVEDRARKLQDGRAALAGLGYSP